MRKLLESDNPPTPLQKKLESVAEDIGKLGTLIAVITFLALCVHGGIDMAMGKLDYGFLSLDTLQFVVNAFMIGVTIIVVAVPEVKQQIYVHRDYHWLSRSPWRFRLIE